MNYARGLIEEEPLLRIIEFDSLKYSSINPFVRLIFFILFSVVVFGGTSIFVISLSTDLNISS